MLAAVRKGPPPGRAVPPPRPSVRAALMRSRLSMVMSVDRQPRRNLASQARSVAKPRPIISGSAKETAACTAEARLVPRAPRSRGLVVRVGAVVERGVHHDAVRVAHEILVGPQPAGPAPGPSPRRP